MASIRNYRQFHALLSKCGLGEEKARLCREFSNGDTESVKELTETQFRELIAYLQAHAGQVAEKETRDGQRKKFIAIMCERGFVVDGKPDMGSIYEWVNQKGCHKPKRLNDYTSAELSDLIYQANNIKNWYEEKEKISNIVNSL